VYAAASRSSRGEPLTSAAACSEISFISLSTAAYFFFPIVSRRPSGRGQLRARRVRRNAPSGRAPASATPRPRRNRERFTALDGGSDSALEHDVRCEVAQLHVTRGRVEERALGHESDDLAPRGEIPRDSASIFTMSNARKRGCAPYRRGSSRLAPDHQSRDRALDIAQPAGRAAHGLRHVLRDRTLCASPRYTL